MRTAKHRAFTVVELLVVVAIIALLVGILLPAIGKARDGALLTQSQTNLRQIGTAWQTYSGEFGGRQMTFVNDYISRYLNANYTGGGSASTICVNYLNQNGVEHPYVVAGYATSALNPNVMAPWGLRFGPPGVAGQMNAAVIFGQPIQMFASGIGTGHKLGMFRYYNARPLSIYLNGRYYDKVFYAPKDRGVLNSVERLFDRPEEVITSQELGGTRYYPSYCLSPAGCWNPDVLSPQHGAADPNTAPLYNNPWTSPSGLKSPAMSQVRFGNLKTLAMEHHWLQNNKRGTCNPAFGTFTYVGCEPWYFNASILSSPAAVFYDGHVAMVGVRDAMDSNQRVIAQHGQTLASGNRGLWSKNTPLGGSYEPPTTGTPTGGYWHSAWAADGASTSFHILTSYGIKGRDIIAK